MVPEADTETEPSPLWPPPFADGIGVLSAFLLTFVLILVALVHGIGNWWLLVVDPGPGVWPNYIALLGLYAVMIVLYRRSKHTDVSVSKAVKTETHTN